MNHATQTKTRETSTSEISGFLPEGTALSAVNMVVLQGNRFKRLFFSVRQSPRCSDGFLNVAFQVVNMQQLILAASRFAWSRSGGGVLGQFCCTVPERSLATPNV